MDEQDLRLIRLVTRHFIDLRGLSTVVVAAVGIVIALAWLLTQNFGETMAVLVATYGLMIFALDRLHKHYLARYGRVVVDKRSGRVGLALTVLASLFLGPVNHPSSAWPFWVISAAFPAWLVIDGWPHRFYQLASVAAMVMAAFISLRAESYFNGIAQGVLLVGVTEIVCGFADHALLERAMTAMKPQSGALGAAHGQESD